jgi:hypothetical protein
MGAERAGFSHTPSTEDTIMAIGLGTLLIIILLLIILL